MVITDGLVDSSVYGSAKAAGFEGIELALDETGSFLWKRVMPS